MKSTISSLLFYHKKINPLFLVLLSAAVLWFDYITGPEILFPILLLVPVSLAAWYNGLFQGILFSVINLLITCFFPWLWHIETETGIILINAGIRLLMFLVLTYSFNRISEYTRELRNEVKSLEGLLPICSYCKKIRDENDDWQVMEKYISEHSEASFSHGLCPDCRDKYYGEYLKK